MRLSIRPVAMVAFVGTFLALAATLMLARPAEALIAPQHQFATTADSPSGGGPAGSCRKPLLLGIFIPWYQYLEVTKDDTGSCSVKDFNLLPDDSKGSDIPLVLLAVVDDLLRIAGVVAVIFVIYGGIQYATSQGSPDATSKAQSTVLNSLIGLVIALVAVTFVTFLGRALT